MMGPVQGDTQLAEKQELQVSIAIVVGHHNSEMLPLGAVPLLLTAAGFLVFPWSVKSQHACCMCVPSLSFELGEHFVGRCILGQRTLRGWDSFPCIPCFCLLRD